MEGGVLVGWPEMQSRRAGMLTFFEKSKARSSKIPVYRKGDTANGQEQLFGQSPAKIKNSLGDRCLDKGNNGSGIHLRFEHSPIQRSAESSLAKSVQIVPTPQDE